MKKVLSEMLKSKVTFFMKKKNTLERKSQKKITEFCHFWNYFYSSLPFFHVFLLIVKMKKNGVYSRRAKQKNLFLC